MTASIHLFTGDRHERPMSSMSDEAKAGAIIERHRVLAIIDTELRTQRAMAHTTPSAGKKIVALEKIKRKIEGEG